MAELRVCYPPDPNPRKPKWTPPAKACDTHFHVFGPPDVFPYWPTRPYTPPAAPKAHYLAMAKILGLERGVVVTPNAYAPDNRASEDLIATFPDRFRGIARLSGEESDAELKRLDKAGFRGVRFNLMAETGGKVDLELFAAIARRIEPLGWHTVFHMRPPHLAEMKPWLLGLPTPVVIDHFAYVPYAEGTGSAAFKNLLDLIASPKVWVKVSCADRISKQPAPWEESIPFGKKVYETAPERTIWGTDWPHSSRFEPGLIPNDGDVMDILGLYLEDEASRKAVLVDNPARLYGFPA